MSSTRNSTSVAHLRPGASPGPFLPEKLARSPFDVACQQDGTLDRGHARACPHPRSQGHARQPRLRAARARAEGRGQPRPGSHRARCPAGRHVRATTGGPNRAGTPSRRSPRPLVTPLEPRGADAADAGPNAAARTHASRPGRLRGRSPEEQNLVGQPLRMGGHAARERLRQDPELVARKLAGIRMMPPWDSWRFTS